MPLLTNQSPFVVLNNKDVDYNFMKVFGCLCYASTLTANCSKFDPRATKCVFLGYPVGVKGYQLYDISKRQLFVSRDVVFFEDVFPFHTISDDSYSSVDMIFPDHVLSCPISDSYTHDSFPSNLANEHNVADVADATEVADVADATEATDDVPLSHIVGSSSDIAANQEVSPTAMPTDLLVLEVLEHIPTAISSPENNPPAVQAPLRLSNRQHQ